jgi:hypothetical protein
LIGDDSVIDEVRNDFFLFNGSNLRYHHGIIHDGTNQTSHDLDRKRVSRGQMNVLGKLEIACEKLAHLHGVESKAGEVEVGKRFPWEPRNSRLVFVGEEQIKEFKT